jgi:peptide/nickel transport system substrate-binding protein
MSSKRFILFLSLIIIASMVLSACTPEAAPAEPSVESPGGGAATGAPGSTVTEAPAQQFADTIIVGAWQQPRNFYDPNISQAIAVEVELLFRPRFVQRNNFEFSPNPSLVEGDLPTLENGGAILNDVTVAVGEPYFDTSTYMVEVATEEKQVKQLVVTGHLKAGLKWDDGEPFVADDLVLAWSANCSPDGISALDLTFCPYNSAPGAAGILSNYEAPDDTTLVVTYVPGALDPVFVLQVFGFYGVLPSHLFKDMNVADIELDERATGGSNAVPLGYGAYKMTEWVVGDSMKFEPNPYWSGPAPVTPNLIYKFYSDSTSLAAAVIAGEIDSTSGITGLAVDQAPYMESVASRGLVHYEVDLNAASFEMLYFNYYDPTDTTFTTPDPVLSEFCVRKAISLALDRQQMVDTIYYGDSSVVQQPQLPQMASYDESLGILKFDSEEAKATLESCGWVDSDDDGIREKNGIKASTNYLTTSGNAVRLKASQILQASLKEVGIEVALTYVPSSVAFSEDGLYGRNFNMMQFANVFSVVDPGAWLFGVASCDQIPLPENAFAGGNYAGWCDQAASDASADQGYLTLDFDERKADWSVILAAYFSEGDPTDFRTGGIPVIPLYTRPDYLATSPLLSGAALDPTEYFTWNAETWALAVP